jgi:hypothetical protein
MTLAVTVVCQDGVVVAADSRTTLGNHRMLRVGSDFTHKVFAPGGVAVATYGEAFVDERSIASHMAEFAVVEAGNCAHPGPTARQLAAFFGDRYDAQLAALGDARDDDADPPPPDVATLGFLVSGYDDAGVGEAWEVTLPGRAVEQIATTANGGGAAWRGQSDVVTRMVRGADLELLVRLAAVNEMGDELDAMMPLLDEWQLPHPVRLDEPAGRHRFRRAVHPHDHRRAEAHARPAGHGPRILVAGCGRPHRDSHRDRHGRLRLGAAHIGPRRAPRRHGGGAGVNGVALGQLRGA